MNHLLAFFLIFSPLIAFFVWSWFGFIKEFELRCYVRVGSSFLLAAALIITGIVLLTK